MVDRNIRKCTMSLESFMQLICFWDHIWYDEMVLEMVQIVQYGYDVALKGGLTQHLTMAIV